MYAGHFAAGLALKAVEPKARTWSLMAGVGLLDLLFGVAVFFGVERAGHGYLYIPWTHSLVMALLIAAAFSLPFWRMGWRVVAVVAAAVMSHWLLDVLVHRPDMGLWPNSPVQLGFRTLFGPNAGWFETLFSLAACAVYVIGARRSDAYGRFWPISLVVVAICYGLEVLNG